MLEKVFFSFHYEKDNWRVQQIRNMGVVEGDQLVEPNDWEEIKRKGENSIKNWIDEQLRHSNVVVVLVGSKTAERRWIQYEIETAWNMGKPILGIKINELLDGSVNSDFNGRNPFDIFTIDIKGKAKANVYESTSGLNWYGTPMSYYVKLYDPLSDEYRHLFEDHSTRFINESEKRKSRSQIAYRVIREYLPEWIKEARRNRNKTNKEIYG